MHSTLKRIVFATLLALFLAQGHVALASSLKIQDFQLYKNIEQGDATLFYRYVFKEPPLVFYTFLSPRDPTASLSEHIAYQKIDAKFSQDSLKSIGSYLRSFLRDSLSAYAIAQVEAASPSEMTWVSAPVFKNKEVKVNTLAPELKAGSDYIKPGLTVKNILNTHIHTNVSYHAQEETLEARLSKQLSNTLELELTNTNTFTQDRVKKVLFGLSYQF